MLKSYLKTAIRSLLKQRVYTIINVVGLSTGIASFILISIFVKDELSFDRFHKKASHIYKVILERKYPQHSTSYAVIPHSYAEVMPEEFPGIQSVVRMGGPFGNVAVRVPIASGEEKTFEEDFVMAADSNFFEMFSIKVVKGNASNLLRNLNDVVITESTAKKYFGDEEPVGNMINMFNQEWVVSGVCEDVPAQSHFDFDLLLKWNVNNFGGGRDPNFTSFSAHTYLELKPGADPAQLEAKFPEMVDTYAAAQIEQNLGKSWEDYKKEGNGYRYFLQPLTSIHLDPLNIEAKQREGGNINYVYFLIVIAVLVIVIACINFMNLATARSAERAREVGVRKAMGSEKHQLIGQFLVEAVLLSLAATAIAVGVVYVVLPYFNTLADKQLTTGFDPPFVGILILLGVVVGFLAGSYPAFVLSSFNPVAVLKGRLMTSGSKGALLRNTLVIFQFFVSIVLIVGTLVVGRQMYFMQNKALGFDREQIIIVQRLGLLGEQAGTFLEEVKRLPEIERAGRATAILGAAGGFFGSQWQPEGSSEILTTKTLIIDDQFAPTVNFEFTAGRGFLEETNDSLSIILNESAVRVMGISDPVGKKLYQNQQTPEGTVTVAFTIVGIIRDFNFQPLRDEISPMTIQSVELFGVGGGLAYLKVKGGDMTAAVASVERVWNERNTNQPFRYVFMDDNLEEQYQNEERAGQIFGVFSGIAIVIACVGLFGLAAYMANLRTKEIGIRKVLGASVGSVVFLLSGDFAKLVGIAFVLAVPVGWYVMDSWLESFAYRIELGFGVFVLAGLIAATIAGITVSYQSIKAGFVNPVRSLRNE